MKIKFEVKSNPKAPTALYTIFMEHKEAEMVEMLITRHTTKQLKLGDNVTMTKNDVPIEDGLLIMSKPNLKNFIASLQLLLKT